MAIWYVDLEGSAGAANGTSFANRSSALATITNAAANGDVVRVKASPDPISIGSCTWTNNSTVDIPANTIKEIYSDGAWTAAANVTTSASTTNTLRKQGANVSVITIATAFTTGRIAHYPLGSTQDFSGYTKVSLWFRSSVAITNIGIYYIALCSDTGGTTVVDTLTLPTVAAAANTFIPLVLSRGDLGALGSSIQSIAIYATSDPGVPTLYLDNAFATNNVNLRSLIGLNTNNSAWFSIRSITGTTVELDMGVNSAVSVASKGYPGATETATTYISDGVYDTIATTTAATGAIYTISKVATSGAQVTISGGWNRTDMSTQTGVTYMGLRNVLGRFISLTGQYLIFEKLIIAHSTNSVFLGGDNNRFNYCQFVASTANGITSTGTRTRLLLDNCIFNNCVTAGYAPAVRLGILSNCSGYLNSGDAFQLGSNFSSLTNCSGSNNTGSGILATGVAGLSINTFTGINNLYAIESTSLIGAVFRNISASNNATAGLYISTSEVSIYGLTTTSNGAGGGVSISDGGAAGASVSIFDWVYNETTPILNMNDYDGGRYISINEGGSADTHTIYQDGGEINAVTDQRHTASGISWKHTPTSTIITSEYPLTQKIKGVPLKANVEHIVSLWARRDNTGITLTFGIDDQAVSGLSAQSISMSVSADTWEKLSLTMTPTIDVILDFYVDSYGGTTYNAWWDDFEVVAASKNEVSSGDYGYINNGVYVTSYPTSSSTGGGETAYTFC
jgi:hypothetical protein